MNPGATNLTYGQKQSRKWPSWVPRFESRLIRQTSLNPLHSQELEVGDFGPWHRQPNRQGLTLLIGTRPRFRSTESIQGPRELSREAGCLRHRWFGAFPQQLRGTPPSFYGSVFCRFCGCPQRWHEQLDGFFN